MYKRLKQDIPLIVLMWLIRIINSYYNYTWIWPDENMQLLEPAYNNVYGTGQLTWEWDPNYPIRSPFLVIIVSVYYWILEVTNLDYSFLVAYGARYFIIIPLTVLFDYHMILIIRMLFPKYKKSLLLSLLIILINTSNLFSIKYLTRTFYNSFECDLNGITIYLWFMSEKYFIHRKYSKSLKLEILCRVLTTINFMIRPSCLLIWVIPYFSRLVSRLIVNYKTTDPTLKKYSSFGILVNINLVHAVLSNVIPFLIDVIYYRTWSYTLYNFFQFNIVQGKSIQFGQNDFSFFILDTYPSHLWEQIGVMIVGLIMMMIIPIIDCELNNDKSKHSKISKYSFVQYCANQQHIKWINIHLVVMIPLYTMVQSMSPHKEHRFMLGVYPVMLIAIAYPFIILAYRCRLMLTTIVLLFSLLYRGINLFHQDILRYEPSQYLRADFIMRYNENVKHINSFLDYDTVYTNLYNSHLHIKNGKYFNINHLDYHTFEAIPYTFNRTNIQEFIYYLENINPTHILIRDYEFNRYVNELHDKYRYRLVKRFDSIYGGRIDDHDYRYFFEKDGV